MRPGAQAASNNAFMLPSDAVPQSSKLDGTGNNHQQLAQQSVRANRTPLSRAVAVVQARATSSSNERQQYVQHERDTSAEVD